MMGKTIFKRRHLAKSALASGIMIAFLGFSQLAFASEDTTSESVQTIWNVGQKYQTIVKARISISNATIKASEKYKGEYRISYMEFRPLIRMVTDDIRKIGAHYYAVRSYASPNQAVIGISAIRWKSARWYDPLGWIDSWRMSRDKDVKEWKKTNKDLAKQMKQGNDPVEPFAVFYTDNHDEIDFKPDINGLILEWSESSVLNFYRGEENRVVCSYLVPIPTLSDTVVKAGGNYPKADEEIQRKIVAECNVLASVLYDDPSGERRSLMKNQREWQIDATRLNKGLLQYGGMDKLIYFEGKFRVRREPLKPSECKSKDLQPFSGDKIIVVSSKGDETRKQAKVGYNLGNGKWKAFGLTFDYSQRDNPNSHRMEFWFDADNNVLRYAFVRIVKDDYEGDIPNPKLGKLLSALNGSVKGRVAFELEYWTELNRTLPSSEDDE